MHAQGDAAGATDQAFNAGRSVPVCRDGGCDAGFGFHASGRASRMLKASLGIHRRSGIVATDELS
jgi:hypothetical protein